MTLPLRSGNVWRSLIGEWSGASMTGSAFVACYDYFSLCEWCLASHGKTTLDHLVRMATSAMPALFCWFATRRSVSRQFGSLREHSEQGQVRSETTSSLRMMRDYPMLSKTSLWLRHASRHGKATRSEEWKNIVDEVDRSRADVAWQTTTGTKPKCSANEP